MRKIKFMSMATMCAFVLSMLAFCEKPEPEDQNPQEPTIEAAKIELKIVEAAKNQVKFQITQTNATDGAYIVKEGKVESLAAEEIYGSGKKITEESKEYVEEGLTPETDYTIFAVAMGKDKKLSEVAKAPFKTGNLAPAPTLTMELLSEAANSVEFKVESEGATEVAFYVEQGISQMALLPEEIFSAGKTFKPEESTQVASDLVEVSDYTIQAAAVNEDGVYSEVVSINAFTSICSFEVATSEVTHHSFIANITPTNDDVKYMAISFPRSVLDENDVYEDDDKLHEYICKFIEDDWDNYYPITDLLDMYTKSGTVTDALVDMLKPESENVFCVYAISAEAERMSRINKTSVTTSSVPQVDITFEYNLKSLDYHYVTLEVIPSNTEMKYFTNLVHRADYPEAETAEELAQALIDHYGKYTKYEMEEGVFEYSSEAVIPNDDYAVINFAYDYGVASEISMYEFTAPTTGDPEKTTYEVEIEKVYSTRALYKVTPSQESTFYMIDIVEGTEVSEDAVASLKKQAKADIDEYVETMIEYYPTYTYAEAVTQFGEIGASELTARRLTADTDYSMVIYGLNVDGTVTDYYEVKAGLFHSTNYIPGKAEFTNTTYKFFDGTEALEAGITLGFDEYYLDGGYILAVSNEVNEFAKEAFWYYDFSSASKEGDDVLLDDPYITWTGFTADQVNETGVVSDYMFFLVDYDGYNFTVYTVAKDAEGVYGPICRNQDQIESATECSPLEELIAILPAEPAQQAKVAKMLITQKPHDLNGKVLVK